MLLLQSLIPATMVASRIFLGNHYKWQHYFGALIILVSISVNMVPLISEELVDGGGSGGRHNKTLTMTSRSLVAGRWQHRGVSHHSQLRARLCGTVSYTFYAASQERSLPCTRNRHSRRSQWMCTT